MADQIVGGPVMRGLRNQDTTAARIARLRKARERRLAEALAIVKLAGYVVTPPSVLTLDLIPTRRGIKVPGEALDE